MKQYVVSYISFSNNELISEVVQSTSEFEAAKAYMERNGHEVYDDLFTLEKLKSFAFDCDAMIHAIEINDLEVATSGITLDMTCEGCPEQYDAYDSKGNIVGYLRLRHGSFTVNCPDVGGTLVYSAYPDGDGSFEDYERQKYLTEAKKAIAKAL